MGYLDRLVDSAKLDDQTNNLAQHLASLAPLAVRGMKQALNQIARGNLNENEVKKAITKCFASTDLSEGIAAKSEKRDPNFTGR
jgi:enoyl-CoA hydratase